MFSKQLGVKFIVYLHKGNYTDSLPPTVKRYCRVKYPCFLDITSETQKHSHEICCSNHLEKILKEFSTDKYRLNIIVSSKTATHNLAVLLSYRWRCILIDCKHAHPEKLINILSLGVNTQKIVWSKAYITDDFFAILFTLLYKNMVSVIRLTEMQTSALHSLKTYGFKICISRNDFGPFEIEMFHSYIQIFINNTRYHQEEYDYEQLLL